MISYYLSIIDTEEAKDKVIFIYENFYPFMCYSAGEVLGHNKPDVEDAVHNAMLKLIENIDLIDLSDVKKVKNLCGIVAKNKARDHCKLRDNQTIALDDTVDTSDDYSNPDDIVVIEESCGIILEAIHDLDDTYRDVCVLKYVHGYKIREISAILALPQNTVSTRLSRAKQLLKKALRKESIYVQ